MTNSYSPGGVRLQTELRRPESSFLKVLREIALHRSASLGASGYEHFAAPESADVSPASFL